MTATAKKLTQLQLVAALTDSEIEQMEPCEAPKARGEGAALASGKVTGFRYCATGLRRKNPYLNSGPRHERYIEAWERGFLLGEQAFKRWTQVGVPDPEDGPA